MLKKNLKILISFLSILVLSSCTNTDVVDYYDPCWNNIIYMYELNEKDDLQDYFSDQITEYQKLVEENLSYRAVMQKKYKEMTSKQHFEPSDLKALREGTVKYLRLRERMWNVAECFECLIDVSRDDLLTLRYEKDGSQYGLTIHPNLRLKMVMMSLSSALNLYDSYMTTVVNYYKNKKMRDLINSPDKGFEVEANKLLEIFRNANSIDIRGRIRSGIEFYEGEKALLTKYDNPFIKDSEYDYLTSLIKMSQSYEFVKKLQVLEIAGNKLFKDTSFAWDKLGALKSEAMNTVSQIFGNFVGSFEERKGLLHKETNPEYSKKIEIELKSVLKPLDIILEKTPFRLTDKFIPGHFGHVAIWVGTDEEIKEYDLWNHRIVKAAHEDINKGKHILEALRTGVELNSLEDFLNVDDILILRPITYGPLSEDALFKEKQSTLLQAFRQFGKEYDFNFDVDTTDKIVCSELAYITYTQNDIFTWNTKEVFGRRTISPDNVVDLAVNDSPALEVVKFYHDGLLVEQDKALPLVKELVTIK